MLTLTAPPAPTLTPPAPPSPTGGVRKLSFGGIAKKEEGKTKTAYPQLPDPQGQAAALADRILERAAQLEVLEGAVKTDKQELAALCQPFYFRHASGKTEVPSSVSVHGKQGEVLVQFPNMYAKLANEAALLPVLGERTGECFRQSFEFKIEGDKLPLCTPTPFTVALAAADQPPIRVESIESFLNALTTLFALYQASDAITVKENIKPTTDFHTKRHLILTPEQNFQLNQVCPITCKVTTAKGRRS